MTVAAAVALWHRANLYKAMACVVLALIAVQYLLSGVLDRRSIETIFTINATRYADRTYRNHPRGLIIYGPATVSSVSKGDNNNNNNNNVTSKIFPSAGKGDNGGSGLANITKTEAGVFPTNNVIGLSPGSSPQYASNATNNATIQQCPLVSPNLVGPVAVSKTPPEMSVIEKTFIEVNPGGRGCPTNCVARDRVAIIIPFRDRPQHLQALLFNVHPILLRQQIDYQIFVVEQEGTGAFNRAMLMNVGYVEALKERTFDCFIFHDVDLLPEDDRNLYTCPEQPRHMSVAVDKFRYKLPYADLFGGVSAMSREHFKLVNGFSNVFWGWGGEDDDMANRIKAHGLHISRYPANVARYKMLTHKKEKANPKRYEFLRTGKKRFATDGLSNLQYELIDKQKPKLYTWLLVRLTPPQPS
ncbi:beta-1,4-N-acetylgalactosaminyltransferase bre-4-like [Vespa mandarinia]|uniref:beta-1,4-N-acetylgalactosaminyltransferase bre-4-like n=1 Tax=Vespa mandarinia TaxID=7446 RepID=UPI001611E730|nr:beta-1,4-N-acetylgalactosaminyltransferase bre-4-like [Vespa mandarinia]XP_035738666.1 beta-1,4-N-acetylgalactosaminyltransferase bre-4-like [Vespa mandarinia]XP_035738667.1 beta-1,4-N-acetylgalactosaminyltransferase bre-4-like [Vespa mandarinia]XP_035738668.1 beta-1,4-N-acetylgalactosaminyltransferase bre-4-like [Vespa mandarinia]XP_035738669.1 beta-1,4-N-acetylgalactosaminyltransferase bre-4-like [Vespa mandarinia]XP_035738670.1 beta-1,4-N-acetylgalactosaminyltransferase bre-4-like [Vespa